jgi:hypothetical protein
MKIRRPLIMGEVPRSARDDKAAEGCRLVSFNVGCWTLNVGRFLLHHSRLLLRQAMKGAQAPD